MAQQHAEATGAVIAQVDLLTESPPPPTAPAGFFRRDGLYLLASAIQFVGGLVVTPFITRLLGAEQFGVVVIATITMQIVYAVSSLGLGVALQHSYANRGGRRARRLLGVAIVAALAGTLLFDLLGPVWAPWLGFDGYPRAARFAVWWAGLSAAGAFHLCILRSEDRLAAFAWLSILQTVLADAIALLSLITFGGSASVYLGGQLGAQALTFIIGCILLPTPLVRRMDGPMVKAALRFGLPLIPMSLVTLAINSVDRVMVEHLWGVSELARYQIAVLIGTIPTLLLVMLGNSWMPRFFALRDQDDQLQAHNSSLDGLYRLTPWILLGLNGLAPVALRVWAPGSFRTEDLALVTAVISLTVVPMALGLTAQRALIAEGRTAAASMPSVVGLAVNVVANLILIPHLALLGGAISLLVSQAVIQILVLRGARTVGYRAHIPRVTALGLAGATLGSLALALAPTGPALSVAAAVVAVCSAVFGLKEVRRLAA